MEFVNFLKNPQQYLDLGAKIPKVSDIKSMILIKFIFQSRVLSLLDHQAQVIYEINPNNDIFQFIF
jgi:hypothetical protein